MSAFSFRHFAVAGAIFAAAGLAIAFAPTQPGAGKGRAVDLEQDIPKDFGQWHAVPQIGGIQVSVMPRTGETLAETIYDQSLLRTYLGTNGEMIMLAVAYGKRQNDDLKVHKPEVCYVSQGFEILKKQAGKLDVDGGTLPIVKLVARNGSRVEPISYWIRVGNEIVQGSVQMKLAIIKAGLLGSIPDGILVRASSIVTPETSAARAFEIQAAFLRDMLAALGEPGKQLLLGEVRPEQPHG